eukprot:637825-Pleurochrysis_carterae.AAC.3
MSPSSGSSCSADLRVPLRPDSRNGGQRSVCSRLHAPSRSCRAPTGRWYSDVRGQSQSRAQSMTNANWQS